MRSLPQGWTLTEHARLRMIERGVLPSELVSVLQAPDHREPNQDRDDVETLWGHGVGVIVDHAVQEVITVMLQGARKDTWEAVARTRQSAPEGAAEALLKAVPLERPATTRKRREEPQAASVHTSNVLDGAAPAIRHLALRTAGDARRIRVIRPGLIEIVA